MTDGWYSEGGASVEGVEGRLNESHVKCQMRACARVLFHFHYCFRLFPLAAALSCSRFAIITFINYESGGWRARMNGVKRAATVDTARERRDLADAAAV